MCEDNKVMDAFRDVFIDYARIIVSTFDNWDDFTKHFTIEIRGQVIWHKVYVASALIETEALAYVKHEVYTVADQTWAGFIDSFDWDNYWEMPNEDLHAVEV